MARNVSTASAASTSSGSSSHSRGSRRSLTHSTSALMSTPLARRFASASSASTLDSAKDTTPRRRAKANSHLPVATPRARPLPAATPTIAQPFSFNTAGRRALAPRSPNTPRARKTSGPSLLSTPTADDKRRLREKLETTPSRYMDSVRRSSATATERRRRSGSLSSPRAGRKTHYQANPARRVDVELGKIVNGLPIAVQVKAAENEWHDQHGSYWINDRLYFCRILRSKTCMVRVGGGWTRLETFLVGKFGKSEGVIISPSVDKTRPGSKPAAGLGLGASVNGGERGGSLRRSSSAAPGQAQGESLWISSQTLNKDLSASASSSATHSPRRDHFEPGLASEFLAASVGASRESSGSRRARRISSSASLGGLGFSLLGSSTGMGAGEAMGRSTSSTTGGWAHDGGLSGGGSMRRGGSVGRGIGMGLGLPSGLGVEERKGSVGRRVSSAASEVGSPRGDRVQAPWRI